MAIIAEHFKQKGVPKVYVFSDQQMWIKKGDELYADAIDFDGQEVYYTETDEPLPPEITGEPSQQSEEAEE